LFSRRIITLTLKGVHKKREHYPLSLPQLFDTSAVGTDTDVRLLGYRIGIQAATGNDLATVSMNLGHSGPWTRRPANADRFNQQFTGKGLRNKSVTFVKTLPQPEREAISPQVDADNYINLRVDDPCGVVPGVALKITVLFRMVRPNLPTAFDEADESATDRYADQDVASAGAPSPPGGLNDLPLSVHPINSPDPYNVVDDSTPGVVIYTSKNIGLSPGSYTVTTGLGAPNIVGVFEPDQYSPDDLQTQYASSGYEGSIAYSLTGVKALTRSFENLLV
jgi:hypothetical protein